MQTRRRRYVTDPDAACRPDVDPDHHLWRNGRRWWIAVTVHFPDGDTQRIRRSLGTRDRAEARRRRDHILRQIAALPDVRLSLRYARRGA